jgi:hypothetical protein
MGDSAEVPRKQCLSLPFSRKSACEEWFKKSEENCMEKFRQEMKKQMLKVFFSLSLSLFKV